jgi:F-type H+-transporting ATPase subunit epsilon
MADTTDKKLHCVVVTPETTVLDVMVDFVSVPLYDGEMGILPGRAPVVARLGYGELRARTGANESRYYIDGGFLQVQRNVVTVLTARSIPVSALDAAAAQRALDQANAEAPTTPEGLAAKTTSLARARAQIRLIRRAANA